MGGLFDDSIQGKHELPPLCPTRCPRYTIPRICGHRQVVRHQLPKLTLAGSSPVARSSKKHKHGTITVLCFFSIKCRDSNPPGCERKANAKRLQRAGEGASRRLKPVRICEANTRTSRCPLHRPGRILGKADSADVTPASPDRGLPTAAGADLRSKYADAPLPAPSGTADSTGAAPPRSVTKC